ncbi:MAG: hypothetical protein FWC95_01210 [Defluviitaleaceae bacterium]|nr:hypothetical protein [Defluviitaleaceae bacterium]
MMAGYGNRGNFGNRGRGGRNMNMNRGMMPQMGMNPHQMQNNGMMQGMNMGARGMPPNMGMGANRGAPHSHHGQGQAQSQNNGQRLATPEEMGITFEPVESLMGRGMMPDNANNPPPSAPSPNPNFGGIGNAGTQAAHAGAHQPQQPPIPAMDSSLLASFVQNERNSALFYEHLAVNCRTQIQRKNLLQAAEICRKNSGLFGNLHKKHLGSDYQIKDTQVDTSVAFTHGVTWALREEGAALGDLSDMYAKNPAEAELMVMLANKISVVAILLGLGVGSCAELI